MSLLSSSTGTTSKPPTLPAAMLPKHEMPPPFKTEGVQMDSEASIGVQIQPDVYVKTTGYSLMHYAALQGAVNTGMLLAAKYGKELLTQQDEEGISPIHVAAMRGRFSFLEMTVRTLGQVEVVLNDTDKRGRTPLHLACYCGRPLVKFNTHAFISLFTPLPSLCKLLYVFI